MGRTKLFAMLLALGVTGVAQAQDLRYTGSMPGGRRARIEIQGQQSEVGVGDKIPGVGTVTKITKNKLVVRHAEPVEAQGNGPQRPGAIRLADEVFHKQSRAREGGSQ